MSIEFHPWSLAPLRPTRMFSGLRSRCRKPDSSCSDSSLRKEMMFYFHGALVLFALYKYGDNGSCALGLG